MRSSTSVPARRLLKRTRSPPAPMVIMTRAIVHPRHHPPRASLRTEQLALRVIDDAEVKVLPKRFVLFTDLHVQRSTMPVCVQLLRKVAAEAHARDAGVICLGDFWHAGGVLQTRALNSVLAEIRSWGANTPLLMIPGNHDQLSLGGKEHALSFLEHVMPAKGDAAAICV